MDAYIPKPLSLSTVQFMYKMLLYWRYGIAES